MDNSAKKTDRKTKITAVIILLTLICNLVLAAVSQAYGISLDMTSNRLFSLSEQTKTIVQGLEKSVQITVFSQRDAYLSVLNTYLDRYSRLNDKLKIRYVDPYQNPNIVNAYQKDGMSIVINGIMVEQENRKKYLNLTELYQMDTETGQIFGIVAEQKLTSAILAVNTPIQGTVTFLEGHDEEPNDSLVSIFEDASFSIKKSSLVMQEIPKDSNLVIIAAPSKDFLPEELKKLDRFLADGGAVLVFFQPLTNHLKNLEGFLAEWGIGVGTELVVEPKLHLSDNPLSIHAGYTAHPINDYFKDNRSFVVAPESRALEILFSVKSNVVVEGVLSSSNASYGKEGIAFSTFTKGDGDKSGPFYLAVSSKKPMPTSQYALKSAKVLVIGSKDIYADDMMQIETFANSDFLAQSINWLYEKQIAVAIPMKALVSPPLLLLSYQSQIYFGLFVVGIPMITLFFGIVVFIKRRFL